MNSFVKRMKNFWLKNQLKKKETKGRRRGGIIMLTHSDKSIDRALAEPGEFINMSSIFVTSDVSQPEMS
tara:strand:- start:429 stop:635 length:207 start_codon:yes stop_codon:yes gene_type:complete